MLTVALGDIAQDGDIEIVPMHPACIILDQLDLGKPPTDKYWSAL
jgi:hypothetical protein